MSPTLVKIIAMILLVAQGIIGVIPGRVLCIPLVHCHAHTHSDAACADGGMVCDDSRAGQHCPGHEHGPLSLASHPSDECGCHVHVPVPGEQPLPGTSRGEVADARPALAPTVVALLADWHGDVPSVVARPRPPDLGATGQMRALKATRLMI